MRGIVPLAAIGAFELLTAIGIISVAAIGSYIAISTFWAGTAATSAASVSSQVLDAAVTSSGLKIAYVKPEYISDYYQGGIKQDVKEWLSEDEFKLVVYEKMRQEIAEKIAQELASQGVDKPNNGLIVFVKELTLDDPCNPSYQNKFLQWLANNGYKRVYQYYKSVESWGSVLILHNVIEVWVRKPGVSIPTAQDIANYVIENYCASRFGTKVCQILSWLQKYTTNPDDVKYRRPLWVVVYADQETLWRSSC